MNLRAVGENPAAADAVGVNVTGMRFAYATIGAALSGAGGAHLVLGYTQNWSIGVVSGAGLGVARRRHLRRLAPVPGRVGVTAVRRHDVTRLRRPGPGLGRAELRVGDVARTS